MPPSLAGSTVVQVVSPPAPRRPKSRPRRLHLEPDGLVLGPLLASAAGCPAEAAPRREARRVVASSRIQCPAVKQPRHSEKSMRAGCNFLFAVSFSALGRSDILPREQFVSGDP
jgi:hypothetical protein